MIGDTARLREHILAEADTDLPEYAPMLTAYHRAHAAELRAIVGDLPLRPGDRVLDIPCGDGAYTVLLAERVGSSGRAVGVDRSASYLELARANAAESAYAARVCFQAGDIASLPFDDDAFDLIWCAQSMYSLPDPLSALRELRRVVRPGGVVAVFENDTLHQIVLPWPAELELAVRRAQLRALAARSPASAKFFIGRDLCGRFAEARLENCIVAPYTSVRHAPLSHDERTYLAWYFGDLNARARPYLEPDTSAWFDRLLDPRSCDYLLDRPDFYVIYIGMLARGVKMRG
ncbi:MAG TPA: methyltransferase domain-containing protein [Roseiflexaceae bacterium]|nr:methyltransferase domain-containing protein [Roseiflexaceae bacterium]